MKAITKATVQQGYSYSSYLEEVKQLFAQGKSTSPTQSEALTQFTGLNLHRMKRWEKTFRMDPQLREQLEQINRPQIWLVLTEGWCGDAAQILPGIHQMAEVNPLIELKLLLRDKHLEVMDAYLTNGARSIPKLIVLDAETLEELAVWGPRPQVLQDRFLDFKKNPHTSADAFKKEVHLWYARDKAVNLQQEFLVLIQQLNGLNNKNKELVDASE